MVIRIQKSAILTGMAALSLLASTAAIAQTCTTTQYPYPLQNGGVADASQVTADLNCAPVTGLANYGGNIGIGTTSPVTKFQVSGRTLLDNFSGDPYTRAQGLTVSFSPTGNFANGVDPGDGLRNTSFISAGSSSAPVILALRNVLTNPFWDIVMDPSESSSLKFARAGFAPTLALNGSNVGIGTTTPAATLHVNGSTILTQGYSTTSDARLKRDIRPVTDALALVGNLQGVRYNWRPVSERTVGKELALPLNEPQIGFLAQDLEKVIPEAVVAPKANSNDVYSIKEEKLIPVLVEAIKEQQAEIAELRAEIQNLISKSGK